jgi:hypothetical protein
MRSEAVVLALTALVASAAADPAKPSAVAPSAAASSAPAAPATDPQPAAQPISRAPSVQPFLVFDPPPPLVPSLRLEALRIAGERADNDWRYPEPGPVLGYQDGMWFMGAGYYRPRTKRSAALHGGSMAATILGEILLQSGAPVAGVGALLTGATLDSAAADVDRDAEARRRR